MSSVWAENKVDQKAKQLAKISLEVHISRNAKEKKLVWFIFIAKTRVACVLSLFVCVWLFVVACVMCWLFYVLCGVCTALEGVSVGGICGPEITVPGQLGSHPNRLWACVLAYSVWTLHHICAHSALPHTWIFPRGSSLCLCLIKQSSSHLARHVLCSVVVVPLIDLFCKFQSHSKSDFFTFTRRPPLRRSTTRSDVWPIGWIERTYRLWAQRSHWNEQYRV